MRENTDSSTDSTDQDHALPLSRRGVLAAGSALGLGLAAGAGSASAEEADGEGPENAPFAAEDHDHAGDHLGEETPVDRIDVGAVVADQVATTRYADSVAELNEYIDAASGSGGMNGQSGVKVVLREGVLEPDPDDLPIELKSGVVVEGQGDKATVIDVDGIGKPVFEFDRSQQSIRRHVAIRDLKVLGNWFDDPGSITPGSKGVHLKNIHYWIVENCQFVGLEVGLDLPGSWTGTVYNCHVDGCGDYGIRAEYFDNSPKGGMEPNNIQIRDCEVKRTKRGDPQVGIYVEGGKNVLVDGTDVSGSGTYAILAEDFEALAVHGAYFENNGHSQDRDGDGQNEPVQIGLAPDTTSGPVLGASIVGNTIGHGPGGHSIGVQINDARGVHVAGNYLTGRANKTLVELGPEMEDVTVGENCVLDGANRRVVTGPLDGSTIPPHEFNDGVWRTSKLGSFQQVEALASEYVEATLTNGVDVVLTDDVDADGTVIDGENFPPGTQFRGVGTQATTVGSSSSAAVSLARTAQGVANLNVRADGSRAVHVEPAAEKSSITNVVCNAAIDVDGEGTRIVGCDAPVDAADVSSVLDLSLDTGGLDPDAGSDDGNDTASIAKLTVTQDSPNHWRRMHRDVTVNLDESPYFAITVPETAGKWNVGVADGSDFVRLFQDSFNTGTRIAHVPDATGWSGEKTFELRLFAVGYDSPVQVDSLGLYETADAANAGWEDEFTSLSSEWDVRSGLDVEIVSEE